MTGTNGTLLKIKKKNRNKDVTVVEQQSVHKDIDSDESIN